MTPSPRTRAVPADWLVVLAVAALTLPFLARPFHVDDEVYLRGAEQILKAPLDPLGGTQRMLGEVMPGYRFTQHPPLVSAVLAAVIRVVGDTAPWPLHAAFLVFPLAAALAMLRLARRFVRHPLAATLLLVATPAFVVSSHGLMTDVPHLALALIACAAFVSGVDEDRRGRLALAGGALALATLTQYRALVLVPLLLLYAWQRRIPLARTLPALLPGFVVLALWSWWNLETLGVAHVLDAGATIPFTAERMLRDALAYLSFLGGATVFPLFLLFVVRRLLLLPSLVVAVAAIVGLGLWRLAPDHQGLEAWLLAAFSAVGLTTLVGVTPRAGEWREAWTRSPAPASAAIGRDDARDEVFLFLATVTVLGSQVTLNLFASVRSLLLALPFLVLLLVRRLEREAAHEAQARRRLAAGTAATALLGLLVATADYALAVAHRDLGADVRCHAAGCRVWYSGEWGFRHAMARRGHGYLVTAQNAPRDGDLVVMPDVPVPADLHPGLLARLELAFTQESRQRFPVKLVSFRDHAGFYSDFFGLLPYSFSRRPLDRIRVFRVTGAPAPGAPPAGP